MGNRVSVLQSPRLVIIDCQARSLMHQCTAPEPIADYALPAFWRPKPSACHSRSPPSLLLARPARSARLPWLARGALRAPSPSPPAALCPHSFGARGSCLAFLPLSRTELLGAWGLERQPRRSSGYVPFALRGTGHSTPDQSTHPDISCVTLRGGIGKAIPPWVTPTMSFEVI
jgi:hypothetical protein